MRAEQALCNSCQQVVFPSSPCLILRPEVEGTQATRFYHQQRGCMTAALEFMKAHPDEPWQTVIRHATPEAN
jgi:hypothetical protein